VSGFRYLLALENGDPADPPAFVTAEPDCHIGQTFVTPNGQVFRILAIEPEMDEERSARGSAARRLLREQGREAVSPSGSATWGRAGRGYGGYTWRSFGCSRPFARSSRAH
jgi:hypothetical protein